MTTASGAHAGPARSRVRLLSAIALATLVVDQLTKVWALGALGDGRPRRLLGDLFSLQLIGNSGAAFSLGAGNTWVLTLLAVVIGVVVVSQLHRIRNRWWAVCIGLVLGGLVGNLLDRLLRPPAFGQGHVVDFLNYGGLFIGNVADIAIVGAACGLVLLSVRGISHDDTGDDRQRTSAPAAGGDSETPMVRDNGDHA